MKMFWVFVYKKFRPDCSGYWKSYETYEGAEIAINEKWGSMEIRNKQGLLVKIIDISSEI